jgi:hypothetical protein
MSHSNGPNEGELLKRTGADVGSDVKVFHNADVFPSCSAMLSRKVTEADPMNIALCPRGVLVTDRKGPVSFGCRHLPDGVMQGVQKIPEDLAQEAAAEQHCNHWSQFPSPWRGRNGTLGRPPAEPHTQRLCVFHIAGSCPSGTVAQGSALPYQHNFLRRAN